MLTRVLDTNVLLDRPIKEILTSMNPCRVVIPLAVVNELDRFKHLDDSRGYCAREAIRYLDASRPNLYKGVTLESGHILLVELNHANVELPGFLPRDKVDTRIIGVAKGLGEETGDVALVTQDTCVRILADALGIKVENYEVEKVNPETLHRGWTTIDITSEQVQEFYQFGGIECPGGPLLPNQYLIMRDETGGITTGRFVSDTGNIVPLVREMSVFGINPSSIICSSVLQWMLS